MDPIIWLNFPILGGWKCILNWQVIFSSYSLIGYNYSLIFEDYSMYESVCYKPSFFLFTEMAVLSSNFSVFIVLGIYNFGIVHINLNLFRWLQNQCFTCGETLTFASGYFWFGCGWFRRSSLGSKSCCCDCTHIPRNRNYSSKGKMNYF